MASPRNDGVGRNTDRLTTLETKPYDDNIIGVVDEDENEGSDDSMLNVSGRSFNEEQLILGDGSRYADHNQQTDNIGLGRKSAEKDYSLTPNHSHISNLSKSQDQKFMLKGSVQTPSPSSYQYANPDLFPVSATDTTTTEPVSNSPGNNQYSQYTAPPRPPPAADAAADNSNILGTAQQNDLLTSGNDYHHHHQNQNQNLNQHRPDIHHHNLGQLDFGDPTFINSFSPPFTPSPRNTPTLPLVGQPINDQLFISSGDSQELSAVLGLSTPDVVPPIAASKLAMYENNNTNELISLQDDRETYQNLRLVMSPAGASNSINASPGIPPPPPRHNNTSTAADGYDYYGIDDDNDNVFRGGSGSGGGSGDPATNQIKANGRSRGINNPGYQSGGGSNSGNNTNTNSTSSNGGGGGLSRSRSRSGQNTVQPTSGGFESHFSSSTSPNHQDDFTSVVSPSPTPTATADRQPYAVPSLLASPSATSRAASSASHSHGLLAVGQPGQSSRAHSAPPARYATALAADNPTSRSSGRVGGGRGGGAHSHSHSHSHNHKHLHLPRESAMISPTMFGASASSSLFPPDEHDHHHHNHHQHHDGAQADVGGLPVLEDSMDGHLMADAYRDHCHDRRVADSVDRVARRQLVAVVVLCLCFMAGEAVGGALSNSLALFTDVLHLGSDLISFIISLLALYLSSKPPSKTMSYGYHRAEVLGALFSVFLIWLVSGVLCYMAVERIIHEHYKDVKPDEMLITASLGVLFNIVMGIVLHSEMCCKGAHSHASFGHGHSHGGGHGHSHGSPQADKTPCGVEYQPLEEAKGHHHHQRRRQNSEDMQDCDHSHDETRKILDSTGEEERRMELGHIHAGGEDDEEDLAPKRKNLNVRAAFIHVVGDIIQSLGVLVAALIIKFQADERFRLADPICTFLFSIIVLGTTITVLRDTIRVMMEGVPRDLSFERLKKDLLTIDGVVMVHSLHIWALTLDRNALSVHLAIGDSNLHHKVLTRATSLVQQRYHIYSSTIQVELYNREVMNSCHQCQELE